MAQLFTIDLILDPKLLSILMYFALKNRKISKIAIFMIYDFGESELTIQKKE